LEERSPHERAFICIRESLYRAPQKIGREDRANLALQGVIEHPPEHDKFPKSGKQKNSDHAPDYISKQRCHIITHLFANAEHITPFVFCKARAV